MTSTRTGQILAIAASSSFHHSVINRGADPSRRPPLRQIGRWRLALILGLAVRVSAQTSPPPAVFTIEMQHVVQYQENYANQAKNGTSTIMEPTIGAPATFSSGYFIADIAAINGQTVKGTTVARNLWLNLNTNPTGSQAVADINRFQIMDIVLEILQADGSPVGSITLQGLTGGAAPPGAPKSGVTGSFTVVGGTGAFFGVRGQAATIQQAGRFTSTSENPINRRTFSGGAWKMVIQLIPRSTPEILTAPTGPMIAHAADYTLVTSAKPARAGEELVLIASGLGPTRPGVDAGQPFPETPASPVSSPVAVLVNGVAGEVLSARGFPGTVDHYLVNFRLPAELEPGSVAVRLSAAWIDGDPVKLPVQ